MGWAHLRQENFDSQNNCIFIGSEEQTLLFSGGSVCVVCGVSWYRDLQGFLLPVTIMRPAPYFAMVKDGLVAVRASVFAFMFVSVFDNDEAEGSVFFMSGFQGGVVALGLGLAMMECGLAFLSHHPDHQPPSSQVRP